MKKEIQLRKGLLETSSIQEIPAGNKSADSLFSFNEISAAILNNKQQKNSNNKFEISTTDIPKDPDRDVPDIPTAAGGIRVLSKSGKGEIVEAIPQIPYIKNEEVHFQYYPLGMDIKRQYIDKSSGKLKRAHGIDLKDASTLTKDILNGTPAIIDGSVATRKGFFFKDFSSPKNILKYRKTATGDNIGITGATAGMFSNIVNSKNCIGVSGANSFEVVRIPFTAESKLYTISSFVKCELPNSQVSFDIVKTGENISGNAKIFNLHSSWNYLYFSKKLAAQNYDLLIKCPTSLLYMFTTKVAGLMIEEGPEPSTFDFRCVFYGNKETKTLPHPLIFKLPLAASTHWFLTYKRKVYLNASNEYSGENEEHFDSMGPFKWGYRNGKQIVIKMEGKKEVEISPIASPAVLNLPSEELLKETEDIWETVAITLNKDTTTSINKKYFLNIKIFNDPAESIAPTKKIEYEIPIDVGSKTIDKLLSNTIDTVEYNLALGSECVDTKDGPSIKTFNGRYKDLYFLDVVALENHKNALKTLLSVDLEKGSDNPIFRIESIKEK